MIFEGLLVARGFGQTLITIVFEISIGVLIVDKQDPNHQIKIFTKKLVKNPEKGEISVQAVHQKGQMFKKDLKKERKNNLNLILRFVLKKSAVDQDEGHNLRC